MRFLALFLSVYLSPCFSLLLFSLLTFFSFYLSLVSLITFRPSPPPSPRLVRLLRCSHDSLIAVFFFAEINNMYTLGILGSSLGISRETRPTTVTAQQRHHHHHYHHPHHLCRRCHHCHPLHRRPSTAMAVAVAEPVVAVQRENRKRPWPASWSTATGFPRSPRLPRRRRERVSILQRRRRGRPRMPSALSRSVSRWW